MIIIFNKFVIDINNLKIYFLRNQSQNIIEGINIIVSRFDSVIHQFTYFINVI